MASQFTFIMYLIRVNVHILGILGNIASFVIFSRPVFKKNSINVYCRALAIFDCFTLNQLYTDMNLVLFNTFPPDYSEPFCKIFYYISIAGSSIPGWILVAFSVDKMLSMRKLQKFDFIKRRSFQFGMIAIVAVINLLLYLEIPILIKLKPDGHNSTQCTTSAMPHDDVIGAVYLIEASLVPFIIMVWCSVVIIRIIGSSRRKSIIGKQAVKKRRSRDFKFALTSLTFNVLFIVLKVPLVLYYIVYSTGHDLGEEIYQIATLMFFLNAAISFLVYMVSNSLFRKELYLLMHIQRFTRITETIQMQTTVITVRPMPSIDI